MIFSIVSTSYKVLLSSAILLGMWIKNLPVTATSTFKEPEKAEAANLYVVDQRGYGSPLRAVCDERTGNLVYEKAGTGLAVVVGGCSKKPTPAISGSQPQP